MATNVTIWSPGSYVCSYAMNFNISTSRPLVVVCGGAIPFRETLELALDGWCRIMGASGPLPRIPHPYVATTPNDATTTR